MDMCLGKLNLRDCLNYLDDILIFSSTFEAQLEWLEAVISRLKQKQSAVEADKMLIPEVRGDLFRTLISEAEIRTDPGKTKPVRNSQTPKNVKTIRAYLGLRGFI